MKQYTPSELASLAGVTPRTIRYYDQKGLLRPASRTPEGYRLYDSDALLKMQRISMLKFAGFSLGEIRDTLEMTAPKDLWQLLQDQKQLITQRIEQLSEIVNMLDELQQSDTADPDTLARSMALVRKINHSVRAYWTYERNGSGRLYPWEFDRMQLKSGEKILDAGCGIGMIWRQNWSRIPEDLHVDLYDIHPGNLKKLETFYHEQQNTSPSGALFSFWPQDVEALSTSEKYDQILMAYLLSQLEHPVETIEKLHTSLKPGGVLNLVESKNLQLLEELDALYRGFSGESCLAGRLQKEAARAGRTEALLHCSFSNIETHVFENDLTFTVPEELYRYLMDSYTELTQELEHSGTEFIAYLRNLVAEQGRVILHSQVVFYRCHKEET